MTRKRTRLFKQIASVAMAMMLLASMALPALANSEPIFGNQAKPAEAAVTKIFQMPENTATPEGEFVFTFKKESVDDKSGEADLASMPTIGEVKIPFTANDEGVTDTVKGIKTVIKESDPIFANKDWLHAGKYVYTVKETGYSKTITDTFKEKMIFSKAEYQLNVYVMKGTDGKYFVFAIGAFLIVNEKGEVVSTVDKVDPTPGGNPDITGDYSKMIFTNIYVKNNGKDEPENPEDVEKSTVLKISKKVGGEFSDETKYFDYNITLDIPAIGVEAGDVGFYRAYVVEYDKDNKPIIATSEKNSATGIQGTSKGMTFIKFELGKPVNVSLKHGQHLAFTDMHVGASFTVTELGNLEYTPTYTLKIDGKDRPAGSAAEGAPLTIALTRIGELENNAAYLNTRGSVTPTGISVDNLPYVIMITASLLAIAGYMVIKNRIKAKSEA